MKWWVAVVGLMAAVHLVGASKILFLGAMSTKSHKNFFMGILNALAAKGHQITILTPYKASKVHQNVREVVLPDMDISKFTPNLFTSNKIVGPMAITQYLPDICNDALGHPVTQNMLEEKFDLIMMSVYFSHCFLSVIHQMKVPHVSVVPGSFMGPFAATAGEIELASIDFNPLFTFKAPYTFFERMALATGSLASNLFFKYYISNGMEKECRRRGLCPDDMPPFEDILCNSSLTLINSVKTLEVPVKPTVPTTVYCGGIHCHPPNPLPKDLEEWVAGAGKDGFIFFSLGSAVTPSDMPEEYRKILVQVFGSLKQRVLWKWNKDVMDDLPPNVRLGKWLPQQDILGDPRLRLFITHGGLLSTLESMYHGVSVLGMPVFADQEANMLEVQQNGWGKVLLWDDLTPETLKEKILDVMNDKSLKEEVQRRSLVMKDQPQRPEDLAVYWVEYVLRHNGAPHLSSPIRSMPWYQLYNTDVWVTILVMVLIILYVSLKTVCALYRWLFCGKTKQKSD